MNTLIKPYAPLKKLNKKTKKVLPASFGKKIIGHFQFLAYFGLFFKLLLLFFKVPQSGHIQRLKTTQRVVSKWCMTCFSADLKHGLLYTLIYTNSTMQINELITIL